jgi:hypothetical protein
MASSTECARRYAYAEPCRRCGGSGRETDADSGAVLVAVLALAIAFGAACVALGWWLA